MSMCPHTEEIGKLQAKVLALEKGIEKLQLVAQSMSNSLLEERARESGYWRGVEITTRIISALLIAGVLLAVGKVTGAVEVVLGIFKL